MAQQDVLAGMLLRMERIRQNRGQKEICYGICVPSYLSKIEHGTVHPDINILVELFARLGISYEKDPHILSSYEKKIEEHFYQLQYNLDTKTIYETLKEMDQTLSYSSLAIEWLLVKGFEGERVTSLLRELEESMNAKQRAYFKLLLFWSEQDLTKGVMYCKEAYKILENSFSMIQLCSAYMLQADYSSIHQMENRLLAVALEEGNTYRLAEYYFLNGTAYACLNMEEMMMSYFKRSICLLQNTGWKETLKDLYYNIGATYISLKNYDLALNYLELSQNGDECDSIAILHKKAIALIRSGQQEKGIKFLQKMQTQLLSNPDRLEADYLKYEEACMECEENFLDNPQYLNLLEKLIKALKKDYHFGHLYFYKDVIVEAYTRQRKYKKALEFEQEISSNIIKGGVKL